MSNKIYRRFAKFDLYGCRQARMNLKFGFFVFLKVRRDVSYKTWMQQ